MKKEKELFISTNNNSTLRLTRRIAKNGGISPIYDTKILRSPSFEKAVFKFTRKQGYESAGIFFFSLIQCRDPDRGGGIHKKRRGFTRREDFRFEKVSRVRLDGIFIARPIFSRTGEFASVPTLARSLARLPSP